MRLLLRIRPLLEHRRLPLAVALLAVLLTAPSLTTGWVLDDYSHRISALQPGGEIPPGGGRLSMFLMAGNDPARIRFFKDIGFAPWWTPDDIKLGFWRPAASLHHYLQYRLWPQTAWPMHLVGMAWLGVATFLAALFYRRFIGVGWIAGLAALLYAVQPGHTMTAGWIANQNALLSVTFGLGALLTHDRWRVQKWAPGVLLSPLLLALAILSGESGVSAGAYLLAYAIFSDPVKMTPRALLFVLPHALVGLGWAALYRMGGYEVSGTGFYIDPAGQPAEFARAALQRVPTQLASIWTLFPVTVVGLMSLEAQSVVAVVSGGVVVAILAAMIPLFRVKGSSQFFLLALALSLLPISATLPSERNFMWPGLAAIGLLAQWFGAVVLRREAAHGATNRPTGGPSSRLTPGVVSVLLWLHLILGPLSALANSFSFASFKTIRELGYDDILQDSEVENQTVVLVNPPVPFMAAIMASYRHAVRQPVPREIRMLAPGIYPLTLTRIDERTVTLRAEGGGMLQPPGTWDVPGQPQDPFFNVNYLGLVMDRVFRSEDRPFTAGETSQTRGMTARIEEVAPGGGVKEVRFTFDVPLEDESLRWLRWVDRAYVEFEPPAVGESLNMPANDMANLMRP